MRAHPTELRASILHYVRAIETAEQWAPRFVPIPRYTCSLYALVCTSLFYGRAFCFGPVVSSPTWSCAYCSSSFFFSTRLSFLISSFRLLPFLSFFLFVSFVCSFVFSFLIPREKYANCAWRVFPPTPPPSTQSRGHARGRMSAANAASSLVFRAKFETRINLGATGERQTVLSPSRSLSLSLLLFRAASRLYARRPTTC